MVEIVCATLAGLASIICALIGVTVNKQSKETAERAKQRAEEGCLMLDYLAANTELTVGVAMALKNGHCNGEVEKGLEEVSAAREKYRKFLEKGRISDLRN